MLSPTPLSLFCALLLCLPLAIVFTVTTPTSIATTTGRGTATNSTSRDTHYIQVPKIQANPKNQKIIAKIKITPLGSPPPPPSKEDDETILQLASRLNPTSRRPRKLAFMFLTTTPLPFAPLWELYFNQTPKTLFNVYVHADPSKNYTPPFTGVFAHRLVPSKPSKRFTPTLASAARRLLAHALLDDPSNAMFALLSPSCIPIHSFNFTYRTLMKSKKSFIEILKNETNAYGRWAARGDDTMLPEVTLEEFRIGSQFWVLTRKHARIVLGDKRIWRKFNQPCLDIHCCYPEENYFPTLIHMRDPRGIVPATLTHVDWRGRRDGHPRMYNASEVEPGLIMSFRKERPRYGDDGTNGSDSSVTRRSHPFLFARKFSPNSVLPLLNIANVIFKDYFS
ncbi:hypothetical protein HS088_TW09G01392 [Tripterygium wilfordii]|uniref:Core-2/I-branching beta-1 6-N-acetylglucosaminyltransferase family protein n=1 Tax=Tripterygium wilfordii TaxID=458696 RepID=A0A7J7DAC0_TRIWF|nr:glycosyltransferase BC10 [Tripterygium wilfordii]KAF5743325.1 hypothetical protein HS088_TW09G01392 [Tripterygium wilfordii]